MSNSKIFNRYDKVEHLRPQRTEWTIRVRAQAVWKGINRETQDFRGFNVIFIDDSNARILAFLSAKICDLFKDALKEGCIYTLSNFHVRVYTKEDRNRAVRFDKHIYFANHTKLKPLTDNVTNIGPYAFDLIKLSDVAQCVADARFLVDVVGEIENTNIECNRNKDDDKKSHIRFRITDGRTSLNVTFFNQFDEEFEKALKANISAQVIVVIVSAKANEHEGSPCLNNYPATRFYFNVAHHSIKALKKSLLDRNKAVMMTDECEEAVDPIFTVAEIKKLGNEYKKKQVQCIITVKKIDQKSNCDSTGVLAVILPDDEIQRIIGKNAFDLENEEEYDQSEVKFPKVLKDFKQKEFSLTLKISEKNLDKTSNIYHALKVNGPLEKLGNHSPTNVQTNPAQEISAPLITIPSSSLKRSPPTAKSSSKAQSREKREGDGLEIEDNVPIGKYKIVKTEKT
ncbi:hypothetical protein ACET3Z_018504 [Daucus carota]